MKYELIDEGVPGPLYRVHYLEDLPRIGIKAGAKGGYVSSEDNLSQDGGCAIFNGVELRGNCSVEGNALISGDVVIKDNAVICDDVNISGNAVISEDAVVTELVSISGDAQIKGSVRLFGNLIIDHGVVTDILDLTPIRWMMQRSNIMSASSSRMVYAQVDTLDHINEIKKIRESSFEDLPLLIGLDDHPEVVLELRKRLEMNYSMDEWDAIKVEDLGNGCKVNRHPNGTVRYFKNRKLHREDGPAVVVGRGHEGIMAFYLCGDLVSSELLFKVVQASLEDLPLYIGMGCDKYIAERFQNEED